MITEDNTEGFSEDELAEMNSELKRRLESNELEGMPDREREQYISEEILGRF